MTPQMWLTIASVLLGFACFGGSFACFMYRKPAWLTWGLMAISLVFTTVIPVSIAVFHATTTVS